MSRDCVQGKLRKRFATRSGRIRATSRGGNFRWNRSIGMRRGPTARQWGHVLPTEAEWEYAVPGAHKTVMAISMDQRLVCGSVPGRNHGPHRPYGVLQGLVRASCR